MQSIRDMFVFFELVLQINHSEDDLFFTRFTFDEVQTLEIEDFCKDFVAMSFDQYIRTMILDMMRNMSFLPGMGLRRRQHGLSEFIVIPTHDVPFGLGFIPTETDYQYMAQLHKERVRARLTLTPFDYPIRPYNMKLADYFVRALELQTHSDGIIDGFNNVQEVENQHLIHQLQLSDGTLGTSAFALVAPSFPDRMSLTTPYFQDEVDEHGIFAGIGDMVNGTVPHDKYIDEMLTMSVSQIDGIVQPELASPFDLFRVSAIEVADEIQTAFALKFSKDAIGDDDLFEDLWLS